jgi:hypothetical protein
MKKPFIALLLAISASAHAAKTIVSLECRSENNDLVGSRLCTALRDEIARSPRYREATPLEIYDGIPLYGMHVSNLRIDAGLSVQSIALDKRGMYIGQAAFSTPEWSVKEQAAAIFAACDEDMKGN